MGKVNIKRSRTPNWSVSEKQYLLELISNRKDIVVTIKNNGASYYEDKAMAWRDIVREMALKFGSKFMETSTKKVKTQWQNMKRLAREEIAATGGVDKLTVQSAEVYRIFSQADNNELKKHLLETLEKSKTVPNVQVKTERDNDDFMQPSCISERNELFFSETKSEVCSGSSTPVLEIVTDVSEPLEVESEEEMTEFKTTDQSSMTDPEMPNETSFPNFMLEQQKSFLQESLKYDSAIKKLKLDSLKEEKQIIKAMRETAQLNKIIAEQRLKHLLWAKKQATIEYDQADCSEWNTAIRTKSERDIKRNKYCSSFGKGSQIRGISFKWNPYAKMFKLFKWQNV